MTVPKLNAQTLQSNYVIGIFHLNTNSLRKSNKINELEALIQELDWPGMVCISEHWLANDEIKYYCIQNYQLLNSYSRITFRSGGTAIFVRNGFEANPISTKIRAIEKDFEYTCVEIRLGVIRYVVVCIYRSPSGELSRFFTSFNDLLTELSERGLRVVVCGDFNIDLGAMAEHSNTFKNIARSFNLTICVEEATRVTNSSSKIIDNILIDARSDIESCSTGESVFSDHKYIFLRIHVNMNSSIGAVRRRKIIPKAITAFRQCLMTETWHGITDVSLSANDKFQNFYDTFNCHFNSHFPLQNCVLANRCDSWYTRDLRNQANELRDLGHLNRQFDDATLQRAFKIKRTKYKKSIEEAKRKYFDQKILQSQNKSKTTWSIIKSVHNKTNTRKLINIKDASGEVIKDAHEIANLFKEQFSAPTVIGDVVSANGFDRAASLAYSFFLFPTDAIEVLNSIRHVSTKHSAGIDDIPCSLLSGVGSILSGPLSYLINECIGEGIYPDCLKTSKVLPIYKKGDRSEISNYRPVAVPSVFAKIFEKILNNRLLQYLNKNNLIGKSQFGFTSGMSTSDAVYSTLTEVYNQLDGGGCVGGLFFDLSRAFDLVDHSLLLKKMECIGIRGSALSLFRSYLTDRRFGVCVSGGQDIQMQFFSDFHRVTVGVPQGALIAPTLFNIYVNDISSVVTSGLLCQYADDTSLMVAGDDASSVAERCRTAVSDMSEWCAGNRLLLNTNKTAFLQFSNSAVSSSLYLSHKGRSIPTSSSVDFLGMTVDARLRWEDHTDKLCNKLATALFGVRSLRGVVNTESIKMFYYAYVESRIRYGIVFWGRSSHVGRVFKMQKKIVRCMYNKPQTASCRPLFKESNIMTLASLYIYEIMMFCRKNTDAFLRNCDISKTMRTRNSQNFVAPQHKTQLYETSPHYNAILFYNKLPNELRQTKGLTAFKFALKSYLLQKSYYTVSEFLNM